MDQIAMEKFNVLKDQLDFKITPDAAKRQLALRSLLRFKPADVLPVLENAIYDPDPSVRMYVATGLAQFDKELSYPTLVKLLKDTDKAVIIATIRSIKDLKENRVLMQLLDFIKSDTKEIRMAALDALQEFTLPFEAIPFIEGFLLDSDSTIRAMAVKALGSVAQQIEIQKIIPLLNDASPDVRFNTANTIGLTHKNLSGQALLEQLKIEEEDDIITAILEALGRLEYQEAIKEIQKYLDTQYDTEIRIAATIALGDLKNPIGLEDLISDVNDEEDDLRIATIQAIGKIGESSPISILEELQEDDNEEIQDAVNEAIQKIQDHQLEIKKKMEELAKKPVIVTPTIQISIPKSDTIKLEIKPIEKNQQIQQLIDKLESNDPITRIKATRILAAWNPSPLPELFNALKNSNSLVRAYAAETLGLIGNAKAVEPLKAHLKDENLTVQAFIGWALGKCGDPEYKVVFQQKTFTKKRESHYKKGNYQDRKSVKTEYQPNRNNSQDSNNNKNDGFHKKQFQQKGNQKKYYRRD